MLRQYWGKEVVVNPVSQYWCSTESSYWTNSHSVPECLRIRKAHKGSDCHITPDSLDWFNDIIVQRVNSSHHCLLQWTALKCKTLGAMVVHTVHKRCSSDIRSTQQTWRTCTHNWWIGSRTAAPLCGRTFNNCIS